MVEQSTCNALVWGSIPHSGSTKNNYTEVIVLSKLSEIVHYFKINGLDTPTKVVSESLRVSKRHVRRVRAKLSNGEIKSPRILVLDIETLPMEVLVWGLYEQRIPAENTIKNWSILCWQAKWLYDSKFYGRYVTGKQAINREDKSILFELHDLLNEADIIIAFNGKRFDLRKIKTRFILNDLKPTSPYKVLDPIITARQQFSFSSNSLDALAKQLDVQRKSHTEYKLWYDSAVYGDEKSIKYLFNYCRQDVLVLEDVYTKLRPWMNHINLGLYVETDELICPACMNRNLELKGFYYTNVNKYQAFQCKKCGAIGRRRIAEKIDKPTLVSTAK